MKYPWTKLDEKTEKRFIGTFNHFTKEIEKISKMVSSQVQTWKRSEQIKYNRVESRLQVLESTFAKEIKETHEANLERERQAAREIDAKAEE